MPAPPHRRIPQRVPLSRKAPLNASDTHTPPAHKQAHRRQPKKAEALACRYRYSHFPQYSTRQRQWLNTCATSAPPRSHKRHRAPFLRKNTRYTPSGCVSRGIFAGIALGLGHNGLLSFSRKRKQATHNPLLDRPFQEPVLFCQNSGNRPEPPRRARRNCPCYCLAGCHARYPRRM